jgi:hypothetical protein
MHPVALTQARCWGFSRPVFLRYNLDILHWPLLAPLHHGIRSYIISSGQHRLHQVWIYGFLNLFQSITDSHRYWGKRDTRLILPTNSSLSVTLDQDHLRSTTTSRADESFKDGDRLWLNGKEETIKPDGRLGVCIRELRGWRKEMEEKDCGLPKVSVAVLPIARVVSHHNGDLLRIPWVSVSD